MLVLFFIRFYTISVFDKKGSSEFRTDCKIAIFTLHFTSAPNFSFLNKWPKEDWDSFHKNQGVYLKFKLYEGDLL